jgi:hypothetical protein
MTTATEITTVPFFHGKVTFQNVDTGEWRTFQIRRQAVDAEFAPGKTVVSLLTGPENTSDYTGFAFADENDGIRIWRSKRESAHFRYYAGMVAEFLGGRLEGGGEDAEDQYLVVNDRTYSVHAERRCAICGRDLTTPESVERGIGPICASKGGF